MGQVLVVPVCDWGIPPGWEDFWIFFTALNLSKPNFRTLRNIFCRLIPEDANLHSTFQISTIFSRDQCQFDGRVFRQFASQEKIDFYHFVCAIWNVCTMDSDTLMMYCFSMFDKGECGYLDKYVFRNMLLSLHGWSKASGANKYVATVDHILQDYVHTITADEFMAVLESNPFLRNPALRLQRNIRSKYLGVRAWKKISTKPVTLPSGIVMSNAEFRAKRLFAQLVTQCSQSQKTASTRKSNSVRTPVLGQLDSDLSKEIDERNSEEEGIAETEKTEPKVSSAFASFRGSGKLPFGIRRKWTPSNRSKSKILFPILSNKIYPTGDDPRDETFRRTVPVEVEDLALQDPEVVYRSKVTAPVFKSAKSSSRESKKSTHLPSIVWVEELEEVEEEDEVQESVRPFVPMQ